MSTSIRTLSQLPQVSSNTLNDKALFEVSVPVSVSFQTGNASYRYASRAIQKDQLTNRLIKDVRLNLSTENGFSDSFNFSDLCTTVSSIGYGDFEFTGNKDFKKNPRIDNSPLSSYASDDDNLNAYSVNYETLKKFTNINSSPVIGPKFGFVTSLSGKRTNTNETERTVQLFITDNNNIPTNLPSFVFDQNVKNIAQNEFIFKIPYGERESKEWIAPVTGIFTCYGWLDEINTPSQSNEARWVALMGFEEIVNKWTILQVQPFIKNNYLSYVGFTFPVKRGMHLKIMTGFAVGNNSDKYFASNASIANHQANAFLGGIYTGLSDVLSNGALTFDNIVDGYITSADLSAYVTKDEEKEYDLSTMNLINDLSSKIKGGGVNYIDTSTVNPDFVAGPTMRYAKIHMYPKSVKFVNGLDKEYCQVCLDANGKFSERAPLKEIKRQDFSQMIARNYYAPPTFAEMRSNGMVGYIEQAYSRVPEDYYGKVFSDGCFMYYMTSQDCNALITLFSDFGSLKTSNVVWMLGDPSKYSQPSEIRCLNIGNAREFLGNTTDNMYKICLPVKKGTVFMFTPWACEWVEKSLSASNQSAIVKSLYSQLNMPAEAFAINNNIVKLGDIWNARSVSKSGTFDGKTYTYKSYPIYPDWTTNPSSYNALVASFGSNIINIVANPGAIATISEFA